MSLTRHIRTSDTTVIWRAVQALLSDPVVAIVDNELRGTKWDNKDWSPKVRTEKVRELIKYALRTELRLPRAPNAA